MFDKIKVPEGRSLYNLGDHDNLVVREKSRTHG